MQDIFLFGNSLLNQLSRTKIFVANFSTSFYMTAGYSSFFYREYFYL